MSMSFRKGSMGHYLFLYSKIVTIATTIIEGGCLPSAWICSDVSVMLNGRFSFAPIKCHRMTFLNWYNINKMDLGWTGRESIIEFVNNNTI